MQGTTSNGYLVVRVNGKLYYSHRLIWLWFHGYFPEHGIDHINRVRSDNRLENLREVSQTCNLRNCGLSVKNTSGVKGVCWVTRYGKWKARVRVANKVKNLGHHKTFTEAVAHRLAAEQCLNWEGCDSNSSAYRYMKEFIKP